MQGVIGRELINARARPAGKEVAPADDWLHRGGSLGQGGASLSRATAPDVDRCDERSWIAAAGGYLAFATKVGFTPPSTPLTPAALGMPRLINSAISMSSRRCFSRTAAAMSSGTP